MSERNSPQWIRNQRRAIAAIIVTRYGAQWRTCFSRDVQRAIVEAEVLRLVMSQAMPDFAPAQAVARDVLTRPDKSTPPLVDDTVPS